jgi:hypothetical protein
MRKKRNRTQFQTLTAGTTMTSNSAKERPGGAAPARDGKKSKPNPISDLADWDRNDEQ